MTEPHPFAQFVRILGRGKSFQRGFTEEEAETAMGMILDGEVEPPHRFAPTEVEDQPPLGMDLTAGGIKTIIWATGYRPDYSWLDVPVLDRKGQVRHDGGIVDSPGMYLMGMPFLRRRKSVFFDGAGDDARDLSGHLASYLDGRVKAAHG